MGEQFAFEGAPAAPKTLAFPANRNATLQHNRRRPQAAPLTAASSSCQHVHPLKTQAAGGQAFEDFDAMPEQERERLCRKWWGFVEDGVPEESARLQLVVAAILHVKASEASVRTAVQKLCTWAQELDTFQGVQHSQGCLTFHKLAGATVEELMPNLEGLHWHRSKAGRVIAAAKALGESCGGRVPVDRDALLQLPGVGPQLAGVLAFVLGEGQLSVARCK